MHGITWWLKIASLSHLTHTKRNEKQPYKQKTNARTIIMAKICYSHSFREQKPENEIRRIALSIICQNTVKQIKRLWSTAIHRKWINKHNEGKQNQINSSMKLKGLFTWFFLLTEAEAEETGGRWTRERAGWRAEQYCDEGTEGEKENKSGNSEGKERKWQGRLKDGDRQDSEAWSSEGRRERERRRLKSRKQKWVQEERERGNEMNVGNTGVEGREGKEGTRCSRTD